LYQVAQIAVDHSRTIHGVGGMYVSGAKLGALHTALKGRGYEVVVESA
jgi:hypothetical protein